MIENKRLFKKCHQDFESVKIILEALLPMVYFLNHCVMF